ncbi:hypothetical protein [Argonema antarcticum]|uniref:hypothetical protein n=1 Tax=Argonema antarcticum TaxID=2942763 RepID=UPI002011510D|nr:hypothetical protein [Argonema antarcticum]MCL1475666.1 hypothetical protein [Argonema antarcticum A004/B2]
MFEFHTLSEFSRAHCIGICAFLVPANLLLTLHTLILTVLGRPQEQIVRAAGIACIPALLMVLHVFTWWAIGVVMAPTYILLCLGSVCLAISIWSLAHPTSINRLLNSLRSKASIAE